MARNNSDGGTTPTAATTKKTAKPPAPLSRRHLRNPPSHMWQHRAGLQNPNPRSTPRRPPKSRPTNVKLFPLPLKSPLSPKCPLIRRNRKSSGSDARPKYKGSGRPVAATLIGSRCSRRTKRTRTSLRGPHHQPQQYHSWIPRQHFPSRSAQRCAEHTPRHARVATDPPQWALTSLRMLESPRDITKTADPLA